MCSFFNIIFPLFCAIILKGGMYMKKKVIDILAVLFGNFLLAVSVAYFVLPNDVLSGGVAGISIIS